MSDNEGLPPGYVPAWTFIRTEDGVVEYEHPAGEVVSKMLAEQQTEKCPTCAGLGWVVIRRSGSITGDCRTCDGTGRVVTGNESGSSPDGGSE